MAESDAELRSFGRRRGRKLSPRQQRLLAELLPRVRVFGTAEPAPHPAGGGPPPERPRLVLDAAKPLWLEIGFGGGEHLIWQAERNPDVICIGCEPFEDGIVKVLAAIEERGLANIRIHPDDARPLIRALPTASLARAFILFPDPWPKRRHQKRRLINDALLAELARVMQPGAELRIATDIADYARTILMAFQRTPAFRWEAKSPADWRQRSPDWPETRYERKALGEGRSCVYLRFCRTEAATPGQTRTWHPAPGADTS